MKSSLVGCGGISGAHIKSIASNNQSELLSVADIKIDRANKVATETGAKPYASLDAMLDAEKPDVLHICTPHYLHASMALNALERGIHVLIEKPCAVNLQELELLRAAQRSNRERAVEPPRGIDEIRLPEGDGAVGAHIRTPAYERSCLAIHIAAHAEIETVAAHPSAESLRGWVGRYVCRGGGFN